MPVERDRWVSVCVMPLQGGEKSQRSSPYSTRKRATFSEEKARARAPTKESFVAARADDPASIGLSPIGPARARKAEESRGNEESERVEK